MDSKKANYLDFVKSLALALKQLRLYSDNHPIVKDIIEKLELALIRYFEGKPKITLGAMRHKLLVDGSAVNDKEVVAHDLAKDMEKMEVEGLIFENPSIEEVKAFLGIMSLRPKTIAEKGGFHKAFEMLEFKGIRLSHGTFQLVEEGEIVTEEGATVSGGGGPGKGGGGHGGPVIDMAEIIRQIQQNPGNIATREVPLDESVVFNAPKVLEQLEKKPQEIVQAALHGADDEVKLEKVIRQMTKVLIQGLLGFLIEQGKDVTKALDRLSKEIEKGLSKLGDGAEFTALKEKIPGIFEEATDELRVQMVCKAYERNPEDLKQVEKIAKKLFKDRETRERLKPYLEDELNEAGLNVQAIEDIFERIDTKAAKKKNTVSVSASELEELKRKAELYDADSDGVLDKKIQNMEIENKIIRNQKERMDSVIHSLAEGLVIVDENGKVVLMNPAAEKMLDVKQGEKVGKDVGDQLSEGAVVSMASGNLRDDKNISSQQIKLMGSNEETKRILQSSSAVIENEDGQTVGMVSVLSDVTKQKQLDDMKTQFVSNVSHELRTPLVAIQKSLSLILEEELGNINPDQKKFLSIAHRNIDRLSRLINDLLDVQRLDAGQMKVKPSNFPVHGMVEHVVATMETWLSDKKIKVDIQNEDKSLNVEADPDRLTQVLTNLMGNAIKFTPDDGTISIEVLQGKDDNDIPGGEYLEVGVKDSGIGISPEDQQKIFDKFVQVGLAQPAGVSSTGLGLTITKEIVQLHSGKIWVDSVPEKGSRFAFRIPLKFKENSKMRL